MAVKSLSVFIPFIAVGVLLLLSLRNQEDRRVSYSRFQSRDLTTEIIVSANVSLERRDDYSCSKEKPCSNGACCGASGFCGYGPTYCGKGCLSQCDATAECGQYAKTPGQKCPLNVCCSQFGFCGTTADFCDSKCQSNCVEHPSPPGGEKGTVLDRVIGYWESWREAKTCHPSTLDDLPLDALTHVYYAFVSIDPSSFEITTMDSTISPDSLREFSQLKSRKPGLKLVASVGGWAFSDNGTVTQPIFGNIARDAGRTATFANNVVRFLNQYGLDGLDVDWEYPGAPDRGGKPDDTKNFVSLMAALRKRFDQEGRKIELTFTAPTSYWYLRWFDVPGLMKSADFINVMAYDLHGLWDATNPIGSIVQGHTNLTEIKSAMELLWRVDTPPGKVVMGFGFYGRSFQLADPSCTAPGCPFKGDATPGQCSGASGILAYYEIQDILNGKGLTKRDAAPKPVHDEASAVNYVVFNGNQWVSYDDKVTFQQKKDWANSVGIGGSLIWASDLDDTSYTAHGGLIGRSVQKTAFLDPSAANDGNWNDQNGQGCELGNQCVIHDNPQVIKYACPAGKKVFGWKADGCKGDYATAICCPETSNLDKCTWRGGTDGAWDCNGQCHEGEIFIEGGSKGGWPFESGTDQAKCNRGGKAFCCASSQWSDLVSGCRWTGCSDKCKAGEDQVLSTSYAAGDCWPWQDGPRYCCPSPTRLSDCTWRGGRDCTQNKCQTNEIEVAKDVYGDSSNGCAWGRQKAACCATPTEARCDVDLCQEISGWCPGPDDDTDYLYPPIHGSGSSVKRDLESLNFDNSTYGLGLAYDELIVEDKISHLTKRGKKETVDAYVTTLQGIALAFQFIMAGWPGRGGLYETGNGNNVLRRYFVPRNRNCQDLTIQSLPLTIPPGQTVPQPTQGHTEHPIDKASYLSRLYYCWATGYMPDGSTWPAGALDQNFITQDLYNFQMPATLGGVGVGSSYRSNEIPRTPAERMAEAMGSNNNRGNFILTDDALNNIKASIFGENDPFAARIWRGMLNGIVTGGNYGVPLTAIRDTMLVFVYLNEADVSSRFTSTRDETENQAQIIENNVPRAAGAHAITQRFNTLYLNNVRDTARTWVRSAINDVRTTINNNNLAQTPGGAAALLVLTFFETRINSIMVIP